MKDAGVAYSICTWRGNLTYRALAGIQRHVGGVTEQRDYTKWKQTFNYLDVHYLVLDNTNRRLNREVDNCEFRIILPYVLFRFLFITDVYY